MLDIADAPVLVAVKVGIAVPELLVKPMAELLLVQLAPVFVPVCTIGTVFAPCT